MLLPAAPFGVAVRLLNNLPLNFGKYFLRSLALLFLRYCLDGKGRGGRLYMRTPIVFPLLIERRSLSSIIRFGFTSTFLLSVTLGMNDRFFPYGIAHSPLSPCCSPPPAPILIHASIWPTNLRRKTRVEHGNKHINQPLSLLLLSLNLLSLLSLSGGSILGIVFIPPARPSELTTMIAVE